MGKNLPVASSVTLISIGGMFARWDFLLYEPTIGTTQLGPSTLRTPTRSADQPHFIWNSGVHHQEQLLNQSDSSFIDKDLPSFSSATFFVGGGDEPEGIQYRFGERGAVSSMHYDEHRNWIIMVSGAERYILSPPSECSKLGISTSSLSPTFRHSLLNLAHLRYIDNPGMSYGERQWLQRAATARSIQTVVKAGEVLFVPSYWFQSSSTLQKLAQCATRSGISLASQPAFGDGDSVKMC